MARLSMRAKLIVILSSLLTVAFVFNGVLNYFVSKRALHEGAMTETLPLISDTIYSAIQRHLMRPIDNSSLMAHDTFLAEWALAGEHDVGQIERYLSTIKEQYDYLSTFFVSAQTNNYYYYGGILKQISRQDAHDAWFYAFKDLKVPQDLDVDEDEASQGTLTVFVNHRVESSDGRFLGVAGVGLKMANIGELLGAYREKFHRLIYMVDSTGTVQVHPNETLVEEANLRSMDGLSDLAEAILANKTETATYEFDRDGEHILLSTRYFPDFGWYLMVEQPEAAALAPMRQTLLGNLLVGLGVTGVVLVVVIWAVSHFQGRLERMASTDGLTGLLNRRHFLDLCHREAALARRYGDVGSLILFDVDRFKAINDTYGHHEGDEMLQRIAEAMRESLREVDILGRLGGEEFVAFLPKAGAAQAYQAAQRVRQAVEAKKHTGPKGTIRCTVSAGVATSETGKPDIIELLRYADQAMYHAKEAGRNRVRMHESEVAPGTPD